MSEQTRDWKGEVESAEDARELYNLGLEMAAEIIRLQIELDAANARLFTLDGGWR